MKLIVAGIGNTLMQDDGIGVYVIQELAKRQWPEQVEIIDAGISSYDMLNVFCDADIMIVVDSMVAGGAPGTIYRAPLEQLGLKHSDNMTSLHELHFMEAIKVVNVMGYHPEVIVFGVEPHTVQLGLELTPLLAEKLPRLVELVDEEIHCILNRME